MPSGKIKWFDARKGFGFIIPDEAGPEVFVHKSELNMPTSPDDGEPVEFQVKPSAKGPIAVEVHRPGDVIA